MSAESTEFRSLAGMGLPEHEVSSCGRVRRVGSQKDVAQSTEKRGYRRVSLYSGGTNRSFLVHRLVAFAFVPLIDGKPQVNHKDLDKSNNAASNLEWVTGTENIRHWRRSDQWKPGSRRVGTEHHAARLTPDLVRQVRSRVAAGETLTAVGASLGVANQTCSDIVHRVTWRHVG